MIEAASMSRANRDAMSTTQKPASGGLRTTTCPGCDRMIELEATVADLAERTDSMEGRISSAELNVAELSGKAIQAIESIPVIIKTAFSVHTASMQGRLGEDSTAPGAGQASIKTPLGSLRGGQRWLAGVLIVLGLIAAVAFVAAMWGPPIKRIPITAPQR